MCIPEFVCSTSCVEINWMSISMHRDFGASQASVQHPWSLRLKDRQRGNMEGWWICFWSFKQ
jgi:hypothetical protein